MMTNTMAGCHLRSCTPRKTFTSQCQPCTSLRAKRTSSLRCQAVFNFGKSKAKESKYANDMSRDEYTADDVEDYFNYMGMLAAEGNYDRLETELQTGTSPVDILLQMASSENDAPKVAELLRAGAKTDIKDSRGKLAADLTSSDIVKDLLENREKANDF